MGFEYFYGFIPMLMPIDESFDVGSDTRSGVDDGYELPFDFTGTINKLTCKLGLSQMSPGGSEGRRRITDKSHGLTGTQPNHPGGSEWRSTNH